MPPGTNLTQAMEHAMERTKVGVFILSPEFIVKKWTMKELMCFLRRREESSGTDNNSQECPTIVPCFYRLDVDDLYHEDLARLNRKDRDGILLHKKSRFFERQKNGEPANIVKIKQAMEKLHVIMGIRSFVDAHNDPSYDMCKRRILLIEEFCEQICECVPKVTKIQTLRDTAHERESDSHFTTTFPAEPTEYIEAKQADCVGRYSVEAGKLYRRASDAGDVSLNETEPVMLCKGKKGMERDAEVKKLYHLAIVAGDVRAMNNLAVMLHNRAEGGEKDTVEAEELYRLAVEVGDVRAINNLAVMLQNGAKGVKRDAVEAKKLLRRPAETGDVDSVFNLTLLLEQGGRA